MGALGEPAGSSGAPSGGSRHGVQTASRENISRGKTCTKTRLGELGCSGSSKKAGGCFREPGGGGRALANSAGQTVGTLEVMRRTVLSLSLGAKEPFR